jgi:FAD/FMN-containing dehydrogenase
MTPAQRAMLDELAPTLGPKAIVTDREAIAPWERDWRQRYAGHAPAILAPDSTAEVVAIVRAAGRHRVALVAQGGNTSMVGGATPEARPRQVVLSLARMNRVLNLDLADMTMTVEAGLVLARAQEAAAEAGALFPLSLGSEGTATIGGLLATNAGGNTTVRYGNARELMLGLEVVLPDGSVIEGLRRLRKDNTGYALRHLFIGSEGTLGVITKAVLRLFPAAREVATALCACPSEDAALSLFRRFRAADEGAVRAFEYMSGTGMGLVLATVEGASLPLSEPAPHYALVDLAASRENAGLRALMEGVLEAAMEAGEVTDAALAQSESQRAAIWRLREEHPEAQKRAGASVKSDVSVPVSAVPALIRRASADLRALIPGSRPVPFGHMGDGNIHMNLEQPEGMDAAAFLARSHDIMDTVNAVVRDLGGSFSAEHGVGRLKTDMMESWRGGAELAAMRAIKAALDPTGMMNPGKVLP